MNLSLNCLDFPTFQWKWSLRLEHIANMFMSRDRKNMDSDEHTWLI